MQIGNMNYNSLDELTEDLEKEIDDYCGDFEKYMLMNGCGTCPFYPVLKKHNETCRYRDYKKGMEGNL